MSKAEQIRKLLDAGKKPIEIAEIVGCLPQYVSVVKRRDFFGGATPADRRWQASRACKKTKNEYMKRYWREKPEYRERKKELQRNRYHRIKAGSHGQAS